MSRRHRRRCCRCAWRLADPSNDKRQRQRGVAGVEVAGGEEHRGISIDDAANCTPPAGLNDVEEARRSPPPLRGVRRRRR